LPAITDIRDAMIRGDYASALAAANEALATSASPADRADLLKERGFANGLLDHHEAAIRDLREAAGLFAILDDDEQAGGCHFGLAQFYRNWALHGDPPRLEMLPEAARSAASAVARFRRCQDADWHGRSSHLFRENVRVWFALLCSRAGDAEIVEGSNSFRYANELARRAGTGSFAKLQDIFGSAKWTRPDPGMARASVLKERAAFYLMDGRWEQAALDLQEALDHFEFGDEGERAGAHLNLAAALIRLQRQEEAKAHAEEAARIFEATGDATWAAIARQTADGCLPPSLGLDTAMAEEFAGIVEQAEAGHEQAALDAGLAALRRLEETRRRLPHPNQRLSLTERFAPMNDLVIDLARACLRVSEAHALVHISKSRSLFEEVATDAEPSGEETARMLELERLADREDATLPAAAATLAAFRMRKGSLDIVAAPPPPAIPFARLPPDCLVVDYFLSWDRCHVFLAHQRGVSQVVTLPTTRKDLRRLIDRYLDNVDDGIYLYLELVKGGGRPAFEALSRQRIQWGPRDSIPREVRDLAESCRIDADCLAELYDCVWAPLMPCLSAHADSPILIVPHQELHRIPFGALYFAEHPLMARWTTSTLPSSSLLAVTRSPRADGPPLALADADGTIPHARTEAEAACALLGGTLCIGANATSSVFFKGLAEASILHVGVHGERAPELPELAALLMADRKVRAPEIARAECRAETVSLAVCEAGASRAGPMDDQVGLVRSLLRAGARSVIAPLWKVVDAISSEFFQTFYSHLRQAGLVGAHRRALQALHAGPWGAHSALWASYQLFAAPLP
jgi:tetratricopeptide (TPR) repeat protein